MLIKGIFWLWEKIEIVTLNEIRLLLGQNKKETNRGHYLIGITAFSKLNFPFQYKLFNTFIITMKRNNLNIQVQTSDICKFVCDINYFNHALVIKNGFPNSSFAALRSNAFFLSVVQ